MTLLRCKFRVRLSYLMVSLLAGNICAQEGGDSNVALVVEPEEDFLIFLGSMSEINGEVSDPLDMLAVTDDKAFDENLLKEQKPSNVAGKLSTKVNQGATESQKEGEQ